MCALPRDSASAVARLVYGDGGLAPPRRCLDQDAHRCRFLTLFVSFRAHSVLHKYSRGPATGAAHRRDRLAPPVCTPREPAFCAARSVPCTMRASSCGRPIARLGSLGDDRASRGGHRNHRNSQRFLARGAGRCDVARATDAPVRGRAVRRSASGSIHAKCRQGAFTDPTADVRHRQGQQGSPRGRPVGGALVRVAAGQRSRRDPARRAGRARAPRRAQRAPHAAGPRGGVPRRPRDARACAGHSPRSTSSTRAARRGSRASSGSRCST